MAVDYNLLGINKRINTPFENLSTIMQIRQQQEHARGLREQREAIAAQRREQTEAAKRANADVSAIDAAYAGGGEFDDILGRLPGHLRSVVAKQLNEATEFNTKAQTAKQAAAKAELDYTAHLASGVLFWEKDGPEAMLNAAQTALVVAKKHGYDVTPIEQALAQDPTKLKPLLQSIIAQAQGPLAPKADYTLGNQRMSGADNSVLATAQSEVPKPAALGSFEDYLKRFADGKRRPVQTLSASDVRAAKAEYEAAGRAPREASPGAKFWVVRDGKSIRVSDSEYRPGDLPASTREQGRSVTSGDAGRIADLDTSLDDLNVLTRELGVTGTKSQIGADTPNWFTDMTGWGLSEDAKSRQAVVDRVRQVIGKALEGGVLRREDEEKYKKILPTIGDPPAVAKSKLEGLWNAIEQRRQTTLDALADANYDVSKFAARTPRVRATPGGGASTGGTVYKVGDTVIGPDGKPHKILEVSPDGKRYRLDGGG